MNSSEYINQQRREYSLYVLTSRAIPYASDGLKAAARRVLWTARDGKKYKSATLGGATMPIHPHQSPEGSIDTLAAPYSNNIPLFKGTGAFGTLLNPTAYGASRYTSVEVSDFTKDVVFRDIEIIPLQDNYDGTLQEPKHFLPLIPIVLLNSQEGIAVGFSTNILPRDLADIVKHQIAYLKGTAKSVKTPPPTLGPINQRAVGTVEDRQGNTKWVFRGEYEKVNATNIRVTNLPYGILHEKYVAKLAQLEEDGTITEIQDKSKDKYNIIITFKKGTLSGKSEEEIIKLLNLETTVSENMNVVDFDGERVWSTDYTDLLIRFTDWRLEWYKPRYERLAELISIDIQRYKDIILAIKKGVGAYAQKVKNRAELKDYLTDIGIVHVDYIADLSVYRFTLEEKEKTQKKIDEAEAQLKEYKRLIKSKDARREVYISELQEVLNNYKKGKYN